METNPIREEANDHAGKNGQSDVLPLAKNEENADAQTSATAQTSAERLYAIGDMAREFGVSLRALRFYEDRGLLHPRRCGVARLYDGRDRVRLQMILRGKQLGFTLTEIREMLAAREGQVDEATADDTDLEMALHPDQIAAQIRNLERQREELKAALAGLRQAHQRILQTRQNVRPLEQTRPRDLGVHAGNAVASNGKLRAARWRLPQIGE